MHVVIGTAGHIDHGKSALVRALTGTDPDRLKEEKERGMTTDLGFAFLRPDVTIIDVPGHEKFVRHMLAGATTIDLLMLVIAADDGIMPQTQEHFEIARLLGIRRGLVVINKRDLVDDEWLGLVKTDVAAMVKGSFLEGAPVVPVSSITGAGIPELKNALDQLIAGTPPKPDRGIFRLPVDRNFMMKGFGTVVAGTVLSGAARVGDKVELQPEGIETRIRGIQVHNQAVQSATLGERAAFNLQGIEREMVLRGSVLATPGYYRPTEYLNVRFYLLQSAGTPFKNMTRVRLHIGTAEIMCRPVLLDVKELLPGCEAVAQLRLETPTVADWGDRYVIRSYSPQRTIGGGAVLEANPARAKRFDAAVVARLKELSSGTVQSIMEQHLLKIGFALRTGEQLAREATLNPADAARLIEQLIAEGKARVLEHENRSFIIHVGTLARARNAILETLSQFHGLNPSRLGMKRQELKSKLPADFSPVLYERLVAELQSEGMVAIEAERVRLASHHVKLDQREQALADRIGRVYDESGFNSPGLKELGALLAGANPKQVEKVVTALLDMGRIVDIGEGVVLAQKHVQAAEAKIREFFAGHEQLTASEFRQMIETSRKYAIPLLNYFDSHGVTQRRGEVRILRPGTK
jgi:selenocysteine-specific elongation factor